MKRGNLLISFILMTLISSLQAQERQVEGKVTTFQKYPLKNVTIVLKKAGTEFFSDSIGHFSFKSEGDEKITVSAHGFFPEKININDYAPDDTIVVDLRLKKGEKNFTYATGYDYISKEKLSSAIDHFESGPDYSAYNNIREIIEGRVPGVTFSGNSVNIRATQVLEGGDVGALLVVDGVIVEYPVFISIPPSQVKSIDVLKGAAASARYGARGMGGVIVVKTKAGN